MKRLITITALLWFSFAYAQRMDTLRFFFEIDKHTTEINPSYRKHLENQLNDIRLDSISIMAFTDFLAGYNYNIKLSEKRAQFALKLVREIRMEKKEIKINTRFFGEKYSVPNGKKSGDSRWRRVDVILYFSHEPPPVESKKENSETTFKEEIKQNQENIPTSKTKKRKMKCECCEEKFLDEVKKAQAGDTVRLWGIEFRPGRHAFMPDAIYILNALLEVMKNYPNMKIEIQGHICCQLGETDGLDMDTGEMQLSLNRAMAVKQWLIRKGIDESRMEVKGFGGRYPKVFPEKNESDKQKNRRVEILILGK